MNARFLKTIERIDAENNSDPNKINFRGKILPKETAFSIWYSEWVEKLESNPSEELLIAARGIHICRWTIPRDSFPRDRSGYHKWRNRLKVFHAQKVADIMKDTGYGDDSITEIKRLITKKGLEKGDPASQTIEDALCLVFLEHQFDDLSSQESEEKMVVILKRTWPKMSEKAHNTALTLDFSSQCKKLLDLAFSAS
jgi:hypothetical protein